MGLFLVATFPFVFVILVVVGVIIEVRNHK